MGVKSFQLHPTLCDPEDCSLPGSSAHGFSRQEYWSGLPFPPSGDLPDSGIEPRSLKFPARAGKFFTTNRQLIINQGSKAGPHPRQPRSRISASFPCPPYAPRRFLPHLSSAGRDIHTALPNAPVYSCDPTLLLVSIFNSSPALRG